MSEFNRIIELARGLRKSHTPSEGLLWQELKNRKLSGYKFLRQHPIVYSSSNKNLYFFIADFYCAEASLVVELDGKIHEQQQEYDEQRDLIIKEKGISVMRIKNEELKDMKLVLENIEAAINSLL